MFVHLKRQYVTPSTPRNTPSWVAVHIWAWGLRHGTRRSNITHGHSEDVPPVSEVPSITGPVSIRHLPEATRHPLDSRVRKINASLTAEARGGSKPSSGEARAAGSSVGACVAGWSRAGGCHVEC